MMYTLNRELMEPKAEIRVGEKVYLVDDRTSVVKKVMALTRNNQQDTEPVSYTHLTLPTT